MAMQESPSPAQHAPPSTPGWVGLMAIVGVVLLVILLVLILTGHGPGRHGP